MVKLFVSDKRLYIRKGKFASPLFAAEIDHTKGVYKIKTYGVEEDEITNRRDNTYVQKTYPIENIKLNPVNIGNLKARIMHKNYYINYYVS